MEKKVNMVQQSTPIMQIHPQILQNPPYPKSHLKGQAYSRQLSHAWLDAKCIRNVT